MHATRAYFPADKQNRFIWAGNHITGLEEIGAALGVPAATIAALRADHARLGQLYAWRDNAVALGREYNQSIDRAEWDLGGPDVRVRPVIPANLGDKQFTIVADMRNAESGMRNETGSEKRNRRGEKRRASVPLASRRAKRAAIAPSRSGGSILLPSGKRDACPAWVAALPNPKIPNPKGQRRVAPSKGFSLFRFLCFLLFKMNF
jgi:hypothetical protein